MKSIQNVFTRLVREDEGAAAAEYAILVAFIAAAVAAAVILFDLEGIFTAVSDRVKGWIDSAPSAG